MPNDAYFQGNPVRLDTSRSIMTAKPRWTGTWSTGVLVPIFATSSILPGDSFKMSFSSAIRMLTPRFPTMDDLDITVEAFFVPHRLVLSRKAMSPSVNDANNSWEAFLGARDSLLNMPTPGDVKLPVVNIHQSSSLYATGGLSDCLGHSQPTTAFYKINPLKYLAYYMIWNEYFADPNTMSPVTYYISGDTLYFAGADAGIPSTNQHIVSQFPLAPVSRWHGYFGSCLPWPQRNTMAVQLPLGADAPVITGSTSHLTTGESSGELTFAHVSSGAVDSFGGAVYGFGADTTGVVRKVTDASGTLGTGAGGYAPANLYADLSQATAATVNQLRTAFQTQRWYEHLARCGNKYSDLNAGMYGVRDGRDLTRPEYLGGGTFPINISQVASTADSNDQLGRTGAFSLSNPGGFLFSKSFTEHGTLMVVACVRCRDSFSQGCPREDWKRDRFELYWPEFANLGEQSTLTRELYVTGTAATDDAVFGYQEAWAEYRMFPDQVRGYANPNVSGSLEYVTYANKFSAAPTLKGFLDASGEAAIVDRTLITTEQASGFQYLGQFGFDITMVRPMPLYSVPGLIDHH